MTPSPLPPAEKKKMSPVLIAVIAVVVAFACCIPGVGIMAAIAIPSFVRYQARAKQTECKVELRSIYSAERALYADKQVYSENPEQAALTIEGHSYVYLLGRDAKPLGSAPNAAALADDARAHVAGTLGVDGTCPDCTFTAACAANLDSDPETDVWSISTADRKAPNGHVIPAGTPFNDFSDVTDTPGN